MSKPYPRNVLKDQADRPTETYPITGIPVPAGAPVPNRLNVVKFQEAAKSGLNKQATMQWSLFIRAMKSLQEIPIGKKLSYHQIAGIHGEPSMPWDQDIKKSGWYCPHETVVFPTWHRPFMLLIEQRLYEIMNTTIDAFNIEEGKKVEWRNAANTWRLPYWDWTTAKLPNICIPETIEIMNEFGNMAQLKNPFFKYTNPEKDDVTGETLQMGDVRMGDWRLPANRTGPYSMCKGTSRHGMDVRKNPSDWQDGKQDVAACNSALGQKIWIPDGSPDSSLRNSVERLLTPGYCPDYESFASTLHNDPDSPEKLIHPTAFLSLEHIHNQIHGMTGGDTRTRTGHMSSVAVSAYDPVFWLHHCFVDKLFAQWQALNWDKWFDNPQPTDKKASDELRPFHKIKRPYSGSGGDYNSNDIKDWTKLGYGYENVVPGHDASGQSFTKIIQSINTNAVIRKEVLANKDAANPIDGLKNDYIVNIIYDRYALEGEPYKFDFYLGDPTDDESDTHAGSVYTFGGGEKYTAACTNCTAQKDRGVLSTAQVPITLQLIKYAKDNGVPDLNSLKASEVSKYLKDKFYWKIQTMDGEEILQKDAPLTKIGVYRGEAKYSADPSVPTTYSNYEPVHDATDGMKGGLSAGEDMCTYGGY